ncbi:MAG: minichromosome maintenance protein MCM [Candidatus Aenigmarchaeota archaeon]|nr:minichromosome maintenance protein MCM [Candidatus Aenigmarchaeota archaeon]
MKKDEIIDKFSEFLRDNYYKDLALAVTEGKKSLNVDFSLVDKFDPELTDAILEKPEETIEWIEESIEEIDLPQKAKLNIRFFNTPDNTKIRIRNIRAEHIGKLLCVDGIVKRASEVRPEVSEVVFECPDCGKRIIVIQTEKEKTITSPGRCDCGCRRGFKQVGQRLYDARWIAIEEPFEITTGERPSEIMVYLKQDLTSPRMRNRTDPGNRIKVTGILKEIPKRNERGKKTRQMEILLDANNVEGVEIEWEELDMDPEEEKKIKRLAKDPDIYNKLIASLAPSMYGMEDVKLAIMFQLFSGEPKLLKDGTKIRGNIHILLIGDPAAGKSQLMQLTSKLMPRGKYVSGTGVTGPGLTATVVKDEQFLGGWVLEAGALIMSNRSICAIDEFSKIAPQDIVALQEAMSMETVSIAKASIVATLPAQTAILAGGNPKLGRFDPYIPIREQISLDDVMLSRFDLKFALRDVPNPEFDAKMVEHIIKMRHFKEEEAKPVIEADLLRKYVSYSRSYIHPVLTKEAAEVLKDFYLKMRAKAGGEAPVSITLRQYESLIRLAEASAKIRFSDKVEMEDADRAIKLMKVSLRQFGFDPETGMIDIDRAEGTMTSSQRSKIRIVLDVIEELTKIIGKTIPVEEIARRAREEGVENIDEILKGMKNEGLVFEPRPNFIQKI